MNTLFILNKVNEPTFIHISYICRIEWKLQRRKLPIPIRFHHTHINKIQVLIKFPPTYVKNNSNSNKTADYSPDFPCYYAPVVKSVFNLLKHSLNREIRKNEVQMTILPDFHKFLYKIFHNNNQKLRIELNWKRSYAYV